MRGTLPYMNDRGQAPDMFDHDQIKKWMVLNCPLFWSLLNTSAKKNLPKGLIGFIGDGSPSEIEAGRVNLVIGERYLTNLKDLCGWQAVGDHYRRHLSGTDSENQISEFLCEIAICASMGKIADKLQIHPPTGKGTHSDCLFHIGDFKIYAEVKRYHDPWPLIEKPSDVPNEKIPCSRSISERPSNEKQPDNARPRSMDLRSKLRDVHKQFPNDTINILFLFHQSLGETTRYVTQTLLGDSNYFNKKNDFVLEQDGLFSMDEWCNVSACCLAQCNPESKIILPFAWKNPRALSEIPNSVLQVLINRNRSGDTSLVWTGKVV